MSVFHLEEPLDLSDHIGQALGRSQVLAQVPLVWPAQAVLPVTRPAAAAQEQKYFKYSNAVKCLLRLIYDSVAVPQCRGRVLQRLRLETECVPFPRLLQMRASIFGLRWLPHPMIHCTPEMVTLQLYYDSLKYYHCDRQPQLSRLPSNRSSAL